MRIPTTSGKTSGTDASMLAERNVCPRRTAEIGAIASGMLCDERHDETEKARWTSG